MRIATWNINSVRMREARLVAWLAKAKPDVLCLQELKVEDAKFPADAITKAGYTFATHGQSAYNGVAILARAPLALADVQRGMGFPDFEEDGSRVIAATVGGIRIVCVYVPNGQELTSDKYPYKLAWLGKLRAYLDRQGPAATTPLVLCGDMNVTRDDKDVWAPEQWTGKIHCSQPERDALDTLLAYGLDDVFRKFHPDGKVYSWWDYRGVSFFKNQGLRIDYLFTTAPVTARATGASVDKDARKGQDASDHAPVVVELG